MAGKKKSKPWPEDKTVKIVEGFHVGKFRGALKSLRSRDYIGVASPYAGMPSEGAWLTPGEARKLRDTLTRILESE